MISKGVPERCATPIRNLEISRCVIARLKEELAVRRRNFRETGKQVWQRSAAESLEARWHGASRGRGQDLPNARIGARTNVLGLRVDEARQIQKARSASLGAPLGGRVETVKVRLGDAIKAGERLFSVRSGDFADLSRDQEIAREQVALKKRVLDRQKELFRLQAAPEKDVVSAEAELKEAESALRAADARRASLAIDGSGENIFWVKAPRQGTVVELEVSAGQEVGPDRDRPLMRISDLDEVLVLADVPENDVRAYKKGGTVRVELPGGAQGREGQVQYVSEVVDSHRRTVEVRVRVKNDDRLFRPNAFVSVVAPAESSEAVIRVPDSAVVNCVVSLIAGDRTPTRRLVKSRLETFSSRSLRSTQLCGSSVFPRPLGTDCSSRRILQSETRLRRSKKWSVFMPCG